MANGYPLHGSDHVCSSTPWRASILMLFSKAQHGSSRATYVHQASDTPPVAQKSPQLHLHLELRSAGLVKSPETHETPQSKKNKTPHPGLGPPPHPKKRGKIHKRPKIGRSEKACRIRRFMSKFLGVSLSSSASKQGRAWEHGPGAPCRLLSSRSF